MFDSVLSKAPVQRRPLGVGIAISVATYGALFGLVAFLTSTPAEESPAPVPDLKFFASRPAPRGPALPAVAVKKKSSGTKQQPKRFVQPTVISEPTVATAEPVENETENESENESEGSDEIGALVGGGDPNGTPDGDGPGGNGSGSGEEVVAFGEGMTRPECDRSVLSDLYTRSREAREARIEGTLILQCSIMATGEVRDCRAIKPLPHLTDVALEAMTQMKCKPATFQGRAINIKYMQNFQLVLPH